MLAELGEDVERWIVIRLAISLSLRSDATTQLVRVPRTGNPYGLQVVTSQGKKGSSPPDITLALRAQLGELHGQDLFAPGADDLFIRALEFHVQRGLDELRARMDRDESPWTILAALASDPDARKARSEDASPTARLLRALTEVGVVARTAGEPQVGPRWTRYPLRLDSAHRHRLRQGRDKLAFTLGVPSGHLDFGPGGEPSQILLDLLRPPSSWVRHGLPDLRRWAAQVPTGLTLPLCPGVDIAGAPYWFDLATLPHLLIGGSTGSGKSATLHALLVSLLLCRGPEDLQLGLFDPKRVELVAYKGLPHLQRPARVLTELEDLVSALGDLVDEMDHRYRRFETLSVRNLSEARRRGEAMPWIVFAVDELADAVAEPAAIALLETLARKGRAAGIHLILATQRPDAETFGGQLRQNITGRLALWVQKSAESRILLGEEGAEELPRPGEILAQLPGQTGERPARVHGVHLTETDVLEVVTSLRRSRP